MERAVCSKCSKPFEHIQTKQCWPSMFCKHAMHFLHTSCFWRGCDPIVVGFWTALRQEFINERHTNSTLLVACSLVIDWGEPTNHPNTSQLFDWYSKYRATSHGQFPRPGAHQPSTHRGSPMVRCRATGLRTFTASCGFRSYTPLHHCQSPAWGWRPTRRWWFFRHGFFRHGCVWK